MWIFHDSLQGSGLSLLIYMCVDEVWSAFQGFGRLVGVGFAHCFLGLQISGFVTLRVAFVIDNPGWSVSLGKLPPHMCEPHLTMLYGVPPPMWAIVDLA